MAIDSSSADAHRLQAFRLAFVAAIGGFLFGFDLGLIGAVNVYLKDQFRLTEAEFGFATASAVLGCVFGPFLGGWLCDKAGRKRTMIAAAALLATSAIFTAVPDLFSDGTDASIMRSFNFFRFVGGLGVGLCSIASPMYIAEIAPPARRGALGLMYQLAVVAGHAVAPLIAYVIVYVLRVGFGVAIGSIPDDPWLQGWRWMLFSETLCVAAFVIYVLRLPESPRWLAEVGRFEEAERVLAQVDGPAYARQEIGDIRAALAGEKGSWSELFAPGLRFALLVGVLLTFFNNWTGWSVIGGYIPRLFELAGYDRESAIRNFVAVYGAMGLMTVASLLLMDRLGRRPLWMIASLLMAGITFATGVLFQREVQGWPMLLIIALVTVPHGLALGGLPWLMMSELFPTRIRAKAVSITTTVLWIFIFAGVYLFPSLTALSQRHFLTARRAVVEGVGLSLESGEPDAIRDAEGRFLKAGFRPGDQVTVTGSATAGNDDLFSVTQVEADRLALASVGRLRAEDGNPTLAVHVGSVGPAFWLFSVVCLLSLLFGATIMPETRGRTLEEIGASWRRNA